MKKIRIRKIIVRETETTIFNRHEIEKPNGEIKHETCPFCHSEIRPKQIVQTEHKHLLTSGENS